MNNRISIATAARSVLVGIALVACLPHSHAQRISPAEASVIFVAASSSVFQATARVFDCLYEARQGKEASTKSAEDALDRAVMAYKRLADDRDSTSFRYGDDPAIRAAVDQVNLIIAASPPPKWTSIRALKTEGNVAQLNIDAINELRRQLKGWKSCQKPSKEVKEYIVFIQNKINLELTSQTAEVAFKK